MDLDPVECETPKPLTEINIIPLVDVMLVLLILFIITAPLLTPQNIPIDLPEVNSEPKPQPTVPIRLSLNHQGQLFWNDEPLTQVELEQRLQQLRPQKNQVQLSADKRTPYQKVAEIMARLQQAGITQLALITQPIPRR